MMNRRDFLSRSAAGLATLSLSSNRRSALGRTPDRKPRLAVITTLWNYHSHAWHMAERFLHGYPLEGAWHQPGLTVVSAYVDQRPDNDLSASRSREFGFPVCDSVAEALRTGSDRLNVDAVLLIGEHGDYPRNEFGQKLYPRYELFRRITEVFEQDGKSVPVFNDKHLSWNFDWASEMVELSRRLRFPLQAGSSLPHTWRMPAIDIPPAAPLRESLVIAFGPTDIYDFHALETLQCMHERRLHGETGVRAVQAWRGPELWKARSEGTLPGGGWPEDLFQAGLSRSQTLAQPETFSHRLPTDEQIREWVPDPIYYRIEYRDGTLGHMLLMNGLVKDFCYAGRIDGRDRPLSTLFYLPPNPNVVYSAALMANAEHTFLTGETRHPVERTLLTSGLVQSCLQSLAGGKRLETKHLNVAYQSRPESGFWHR